MREVRIRREPSGWITVERLHIQHDGHSLGITPRYHMNLGSALWDALRWIWRAK